MYGDPSARVPVMALSWNYFAVGYCRDCIMAAVEIDRVVMSLRVHVLALDEAFAFADGDTLNQHNWELAIVPHYWFLHYYNMDPRWNCLGYLNISVGGSSAAAMIVVSKFWNFFSRQSSGPILAVHYACSVLVFAFLCRSLRLLCRWEFFIVSSDSVFLPTSSCSFNWLLMLRGN